MGLQRLLRLPIASVGLASFLLIGCTQQRDFNRTYANTPYIAYRGFPNTINS
jgi:hypothetical protein